MVVTLQLNEGKLAHPQLRLLKSSWQDLQICSSSTRSISDGPSFRETQTLRATTFQDGARESDITCFRFSNLSEAGCMTHVSDWTESLGNPLDDTGIIQVSVLSDNYATNLLQVETL